MYEHLLAWTGFALLLVLCLPFVGVRKLVLEVYAWGLRIALLALLAGGAVLWFRPDLLPAGAFTVLDAFPGVRGFLPTPGSPTFGMAVAALAAAVLLPVLAVLDVTRKLAGVPPQRLRPEPISPPAERSATEPRPLGQPALSPRRADRRGAADTMAEVGSRKPFRVADETT